MNLGLLTAELNKSLIQAISKTNGPCVLKFNRRNTSVSLKPYTQAFFLVTKTLIFNLKKKSNILFEGKISFQEAARGTACLSEHRGGVSWTNKGRKPPLRSPSHAGTRLVCPISGLQVFSCPPWAYLDGARAICSLRTHHHSAKAMPSSAPSTRVPSGMGTGADHGPSQDTWACIASLFHCHGSKQPQRLCSAHTRTCFLARKLLVASGSRSTRSLQLLLNRMPLRRAWDVLCPRDKCDQ